MNNPLFHLKKRKLAPDYFKLRAPWFFNTPDVYPFAYIALGMVVSLCLLGLLLLVALGAFSGTSESASSPPVESTTVSPPEASAENQTETAQGTDTTSVEGNDTNVSPLIKNAQNLEDVDTKIRNAQSQPTYDLKLQALIKLEEAEGLTVEQANEIKALKQEYTDALTQAQQSYLAIESALEKEHYSVAIEKSQALITQGEILGVIYTNAQDSLEKAHLRKIDYYLKVAQLGKAEQALNEAKAAGLKEEKLQDYTSKIQALKNL